MQIKTKYFGEVDYDESKSISFPSGFFGFEDEKSFLLMPFEGSGGTLLCFQSTVTPQLAFVAMNPFALHSEYQPVLTDDELKALDVSHSTELCFYVLCVVREPVSESKVNMRCPIALNEDTRTAMQVILESDEYHMRHKLSEFQSKGE